MKGIQSPGIFRLEPMLTQEEFTKETERIRKKDIEVIRKRVDIDYFQNMRERQRVISTQQQDNF